MHTLTQDQTAALVKIRAFLTNHEAVAFLLEGGAGVGKTYLLGEILAGFTVGTRCACTPTHKATNVLRRKLEAHHVPWCRGYDPYSWNGTDVVTGTTASLLGIGPVITEEQGDEVKFGKAAGRGLLSKFTPSLLVIDEVSMLGLYDFLDLCKHAKARGMKVLAMGDAGQLPPVKRQQIPFEKFSNGAKLTEIVRQGKDSAIIQVAWAIRQGDPWRGIVGPGVVQTEQLATSFLGRLLEVDEPAKLAEEDRPVFIAYRNKVVDRMQDEACRLIYRHPAAAFAPGELVLSDTNLYRNKTLLCANQDELVVGTFHEAERDKVVGVPVTLKHRADNCFFRSHYLSPEELANPAHPYRVELKARELRAKTLKQQYESLSAGSPSKASVNAARIDAWRQFFEWRDSTIMSFRHPFAITSHKSQGSTYRSCYVDVADIAGHSSQALYVAVTRPREELVLSA